MNTKTISKQAKKAIAIGLCTSLVGGGGLAVPVLSTTHDAYAAVASKPQVNGSHEAHSYIQFKDPVFKERILAEMKKHKLIDQSVQDITEADALKVKILNLMTKTYEKNIDAKGFQSIDGIENFKNLTELNLTNNQISDITSIAALTKLRFLALNGNHISDITPLSKLTKLNYVCLKGNQVRNLKCLTLPPRYNIDAKEQFIYLQPTTATVDLKKEIKGFDDGTPVLFNGVMKGVYLSNGVLTYKRGIENPYTVTVLGNDYSATVYVDFSKVKLNFEIQAENISEELRKLLDGYDAIKNTDNYKNADNNPKQAYDKAITDGKAIYDKLSSTPEQVKQAVEKIKTALGALNGDAKTSASVLQLQNHIQQLEQELNKVKQQGTADKATIERLTSELQQAKDALNKLKEDKILSEQQKQAEIDKLNGQIEELNKQVAQLTKDKGSLQQQLDTANGKVQTLTDELNKAKQQGTADKATIERLTSELQQAKYALEKLKNDKTKSDSEKQAEIDKLNGQIEELNKQVAQLTKDKTQVVNDGIQTDTSTGTDTSTDTGTQTDTSTGTDTSTDTGTQTDTSTGIDTSTDTGTQTDETKPKRPQSVSDGRKQLSTLPKTGAVDTPSVAQLAATTLAGLGALCLAYIRRKKEKND